MARLGQALPVPTAGHRVHILNNYVIPSSEAHGGGIEAVLSDNGREFRGRPKQHSYELVLQLKEIRARTTTDRRPQSNGIVERFHGTALDEHFHVEGHRTWFETNDVMQASLDGWLVTDSTKRPHKGRNVAGRTPLQAFIDGPKAADDHRKERKEKR